MSVLSGEKVGKKKLIRIGGTKKYVTTGLCNILPLS